MRFQHFLAGSCAGFALMLAACGPSATSTPTTEAQAPAPVTPSAPAIIPVSTPDFVTKAAMTDMFEIQAGQLASTRAQNADIKAFARTMVHDHRATTAQLTTIVHGVDGVTLPTALDDEHTSLLNDLRNASAADFDQKYVDQQTHAHANALDLMQNYSQHGDNSALQAFATETAPKVQHHLDMVRGLDRSGADEPPPHT